MLNNEKIILMTKLALYEQGEGKKKIPIGKYFRSDYIGMRLLSSFIYINIAYIICVALWLIDKGDDFIKKMMGSGMTSMIIVLALIYVAVVVVYMIISYVFFTYKFKSTRRSLKEYNAQLKQLYRLQEKEAEAFMSETDLDMGGEE